MAKNFKIVPVGIPAIGAEISIDGQIYRCVRHEPYRCQSGKVSAAAYWEAACADCGDLFQTPSFPNGWPGGRRCRLHTQPGQRVDLDLRKPGVDGRRAMEEAA